ncbi:MAG: hypothetical protein HY096_00280 [Nitrospinae bacterium]|nr:hypothetical protein [Nitrospinota bacterium]
MTTTAFKTEAQKQEGAKPRGLLQIDLNVSGTLYISDQPITIGANTYRALIKDWGNTLTGEDTIGNIEITLLNHNDATYGRFSNYDKTDLLTNATVRVYKWFDGLVEADMEPLFKGVIDDFSYTLNEFRLSINDGTQQEHKQLPAKKLSFYDYPNAKQDDIGKMLSIVYGETGEILNAQKINKGYGSVPAVLIDKASRKYLVAGHVGYSIPSSVWVGLSGLPDGYAYMEGCTGNANDGGYSTIILPEKMLCGYFLSAFAVGAWFTNTAQNPANVCDRNTATSATLNTTYPLLDVMVAGMDKGGDIKKVKIATSAAHTGCRTRWAGPKAKLYEACSAGATSIKIDSGAGMDFSGFMDIANGDRISYTSLTEDSGGAFWTVGGIPGSGADSVSSSHSVNDPVVMVGDWLTLSTAEVDITSQRDWSNFDFYKFEIIIEWQSGANYTPSYVGFRIEFEITEYPQIFAAVKGWSLTNRRNAIEQVKHIFTNYLNRASGNIGDSFADAIADLETLNWKTDFSVHEEINSKELIAEILKECKTSFWLDGQGKTQVKVFKFSKASTKYISYDTDIIDPDGNDFKVTHTSVDEVYNEVYLKFAKDYNSGNFTKEYYITPTTAYPADSDRVSAASQSKTDYKTTNRLTVECPYIQDDTTALNLLQYYFDYYHRRREIFEFSVSLKYFDIQIGDIAFPSHPLNHNSKSANVIKIIREENIVKVTGREYGSEVSVADTVRFSDSIVRRLGQGYGKDGYGVKYGGNFTTL